MLVTGSRTHSPFAASSATNEASPDSSTAVSTSAACSTRRSGIADGSRSSGPDAGSSSSGPAGLTVAPVDCVLLGRATSAGWTAGTSTCTATYAAHETASATVSPVSTRPEINVLPPGDPWSCHRDDVPAT